MKAYELFCLRSCEHGSDLDDWLSAEREFSSEADDVVVTQTEAGFEISIAERAEQNLIFLSIAPTSLLILWTKAELHLSEQNTNFHGSTVSLTPLPEPADPARAEVIYRDGRVRVHLPYVVNSHSSSELNTPADEREPTHAALEAGQRDSADRNIEAMVKSELRRGI